MRENCAAEMVSAPDAVGPTLTRRRLKIGYFPIEDWNINSNTAINQTETFSSAHFPGNGCNNNVMRLCLVTVKVLDSVHASDLASHPVHFTTKRREIVPTYFNVLQVKRRTLRL